MTLELSLRNVKSDVTKLWLTVINYCLYYLTSESTVDLKSKSVQINTFSNKAFYEEPESSTKGARNLGDNIQEGTVLSLTICVY